jgi:hypothetical protein
MRLCNVASLMSVSAVVKEFNGSLQRERDKQADRDRQQMKEEVSPSPRRVMNRMNVHVLSPQCSLTGEFYLNVPRARRARCDAGCA